MKNAAYHAVRSRQGSRTCAASAGPGASPDPAGSAEAGFDTGSQTASASAAGTAQMASAAGQDPPSASRSGTSSPPASIAPPMTPAVYSPVTGPTRSGKR